jgi:hypothetical protein
VLTECAPSKGIEQEEARATRGRGRFLSDGERRGSPTSRARADEVVEALSA